MRVVFSEGQVIGGESKTGAVAFVVVTLVFINSWQDRSYQSHLMPLRTARAVLHWRGERCEPLPGCRQLPALQHPWLPPATTCQAQAGGGRGGCSSCEIGSWPQSRQTLGRGCFPHPRCFQGRGHSGLAQHRAEQHSQMGRPVEEPAIFSETHLGDTSLQLVAFSIASSAGGATLPSRERKTQTKQHNPPSKSSFRDPGFN